MRTTWPSQTGLDGKFRSGIMFLLSVLLALTPVGSAWAQLFEQLSKDLGTIYQQKSRAEEFARLLKKAYENKKISDNSLQQGERLYIDAKAAFDGWITKLQFDLKAGRESKSAQEEKILQAAVEKSERFTAYVDQLLFGESRGAAAVAAIVTTVVTALTTAGLNIWGECRKANQEERERLVKELEKLKWQPFGQIK